MPRSPAFAALRLTSLLWSVSACGAFHDDAHELLARGRPIEALAELRAQEAGARRWERCRFARYALDRGIVHLAVGDVGEGGTWIARAEDGEARSPGCLDHGDRGRLASAVKALPAR